MKNLRRNTRLALVGALLAGALTVSAYLYPHVFAIGALRVGNGLFGGVLPYNLTLADLSFSAALLLDEEVPDAWHQRARIAFLRGDFVDARQKIERQIAIHGDSFMAAYYIRGLIKGYAGQYGEAEKDFKKFLEWDPTNWAANNDLAWIYFSQGKFKETAEQASIGLAHSPTNPWLLMMHAMAIYNLGDSERAAQELALAKTSAEHLTEGEWSTAYPGNDPGIAAEGLAEFRRAIEKNLLLVHTGQMGSQ